MNRVKCLKPLQNCRRLEELYLRRNEISSLSELEHLKDLKFLKTLWIDENPCTADNRHRSKVLQILPNLTCLDDKPVSIEDLLSARNNEKSDVMHMEARTVVDNVIPNSPRTLQLFTSSTHREEQHDPAALMFASMYGGTFETEQNDEPNLWHQMR